ncbi:cell wall metabolism sensor histidine kinase WalK [Virgibacillus ndiopensis]|uniref:cell wall metabolism sensor histidine kinase WalK n=1 Tax=Virgibacillus ndiopensis TaxID=2004408 RepID=UPI000C089FE7|nr:cell wall metabolism sensor histidine kinase WalK [Virgibacillus ndiopensis]
MKKVGFFRSIQLKFIIIYILLLLVAVQVIGSYFAQRLEETLRTNFEDSVSNNVKLTSTYLEQAFTKERTEDGPEKLRQDVQEIVSEVEKEEMSFQVVNNLGIVLATNDYSSTTNVGKKTTNPIIQIALNHGESRTKRMWDSKNKVRLFVKAVPIYNDKQLVVGAIYIQASLEGVYSQLETINQIFLKGSILAIAVSAFLGILIARTITKPILEMRNQAQTMAKGDFTQKVNVYGADEIGNLAETFNDLNERLKHSYATIEEERRKLSSVLSNMSDGVIATDRTGAITLMNDAAGKLIGMNPEDIRNEYLPEILQLGEKDVDITELHDSGSMIIDLSEDDDIFLIRANFSTISDDEEDIIGFITVISDVTEQEQIEQERREFVSNVSHELRTPLTTMRSYIEALTDGAWQDKNIAPKFLSVTQNETERMIRMVNDLLQLSKMDNKDYGLHMEKTDFLAYLNHIIDRFAMNEHEGIKLQRELPKGQFYVWMDKDKMTQVLDNIISNAIKYSPEGGTIRFKIEKQRHQLLVSVQDQGIGISYDKVDKIFDRFYRADKARTRKLGGTGLGLAIARELVEAHHGKIWAKSKVGKGTTIFFTLPLMNKKRRGDQ